MATDRSSGSGGCCACLMGIGKGDSYDDLDDEDDRGGGGLYHEEFHRDFYEHPRFELARETLAAIAPWSLAHNHSLRVFAQLATHALLDAFGVDAFEAGRRSRGTTGKDAAERQTDAALAAGALLGKSAEAAGTTAGHGQTAAGAGAQAQQSAQDLQPRL